MNQKFFDPEEDYDADGGQNQGDNVPNEEKYPEAFKDMSEGVKLEKKEEKVELDKNGQPIQNRKERFA